MNFLLILGWNATFFLMKNEMQLLIVCTMQTCLLMSVLLRDVFNFFNQWKRKQKQKTKTTLLSVILPQASITRWSWGGQVSQRCMETSCEALCFFWLKKALCLAKQSTHSESLMGLSSCNGST